MADFDRTNRVETESLKAKLSAPAAPVHRLHRMNRW
jgi:hypothetical protein